MQIRDMLGQYSQNVKNGTEELMSAQGTQKLVSSMQELEPGSTFEGTVNSVKNGKVVLALGNGQTITARLDGKVSIQPGESMFFQVRSNDGTTIALRPYVQAGNINNPILLNALTAAGVPATERNITMVDSMMKEQMSISRQSILDMGRVVGSNPNVNVNTAVLMTKIGLPVSAEMASQFENYMVDQHAIVDEMDLAMNQLGRLLGDADLGEEQSFELYGKVLDILNGEGETPAQTTDGLQQNDTGTMVNAGENIEMEAAVQQSKNGTAAEYERPDFNGSSRAGTECRCGRKRRKYCGGADRGKCSAEYADRHRCSGRFEKYTGGYGRRFQKCAGTDGHLRADLRPERSGSFKTFIAEYTDAHRKYRSF